MATQSDIDFSYTIIDRIFRRYIGETADFTCALYDGYQSVSLEEAQANKHRYIHENLNIEPGQRILDMGCGWGPLLSYFGGNGIQAVGVTLSTGQLKACMKNGFDAHLIDCRTITPAMFGTFDAVTCVEAFEHFCSKEECRAGKQDEIYSDFFKTVYDLLPAGGRFYLQTATFGPNMCDPDSVDINAPKGSVERIVALMEILYPGSWLPQNPDQIIKLAEPFFRLIYQTNGRLDYIKTQSEFIKRVLEFDLKKYAYYLSLIPSYLFNPQFRLLLKPFWSHVNRECFRCDIMDHYRFVFERL